MADADRELGALGAQVEALDKRVETLTDKMEEQGKTLEAIRLELASAKGAGRAVVGIAVMFGGIASLIAQKFIGKFF